MMKQTSPTTKYKNATIHHSPLVLGVLKILQHAASEKKIYLFSHTQFFWDKRKNRKPFSSSENFSNYAYAKRSVLFTLRVPSSHYISNNQTLCNGILDKLFCHYGGESKICQAGEQSKKEVSRGGALSQSTEAVTRSGLCLLSQNNACCGKRVHLKSVSGPWPLEQCLTMWKRYHRWRGGAVVGWEKKRSFSVDNVGEGKITECE